MDRVVVDVEIQRTIEETPGGWDATDLLGVACAVLYEEQTDRFRLYGPTEEDRRDLIVRLRAADEVWGFNIWKFDFPVIWRLPGRERVVAMQNTTRDMLVGIWRALGLNPDEFNSLHKGWGLDAVAKGTFGVGKSGYGGDAPKWFQAGNWSRLVDYCLDDVRMERDLMRFILRHGFIVRAPDNRVVRVNVDDCRIPTSQ